MALTLTLNGMLRRFEDLDPGASLSDLIQALALKGDRVALEHNGEIAARKSWISQPIAEGDKIELVHFVGGGSNSSFSTRIVAERRVKPSCCQESAPSAQIAGRGSE